LLVIRNKDGVVETPVVEESMPIMGNAGDVQDKKNLMIPEGAAVSTDTPKPCFLKKGGGRSGLLELGNLIDLPP